MTNEQLVLEIQTGDTEASADLFTQNKGLIHNILVRFPAHEYEDLQQVAFLAVLYAAQHFKPDNGNMFTAYMTKCVFGYCMKYMKRQPRDVLSLDVENEDGGTLLNTLQDPDAELEYDNAVERVHSIQLRTVLDDCMSRLSDEESGTIRAKYYAGLTLPEIAAKRGVDVKDIRRTERRAVTRMRQGENMRRLKAYREHMVD